MVIQKSLLITDLDGTLLNSQSEIGEKDLTVLKAYIRQGGRLILASGRPYRLLEKYIQQLGLQDDDLVICRDGQYVHKASGEVVSAAPLLCADDFFAVIDLFPTIRIDAYSENIDYIYAKSLILYFKLKLHSLKDKRRRIVRNTPKTDLKFEKIKIFSDNIPVEALEMLQSKYSLKKIRGASYEINYMGVSKYAALHSILSFDAYQGLDLLYFGDDDNDLECFQNIPFSIATENASKAILKVAKYTTKSNDANGVSYFLENMEGFNGLSAD